MCDTDGTRSYAKSNTKLSRINNPKSNEETRAVWKTVVLSRSIRRTCEMVETSIWNARTTTYYDHCRSFSLILSLFFCLFPRRQTANSFFMPTDCIVAFDYRSADSSFFTLHTVSRAVGLITLSLSHSIEHYIVTMDKWYLVIFLSLFAETSSQKIDR